MALLVPVVLKYKPDDLKLTVVLEDYKKAINNIVDCINAGILPDTPSAPAPVINPGGGDFDVTDYGAYCDGIHDDSEAIQKAELARFASGGGRVIFPPRSSHIGSNGVYLVSDLHHILIPVYNQDGTIKRYDYLGWACEAYSGACFEGIGNPTIKLKTGYTSDASPKGFLSFASVDTAGITGVIIHGLTFDFGATNVGTPNNLMNHLGLLQGVFGCWGEYVDSTHTGAKASDVYIYDNIIKNSAGGNVIISSGGSGSPNYRLGFRWHIFRNYFLNMGIACPDCSVIWMWANWVDIYDNYFIEGSPHAAGSEFLNAFEIHGSAHNVKDNFCLCYSQFGWVAPNFTSAVQYSSIHNNVALELTTNGISFYRNGVGETSLDYTNILDNMFTFSTAGLGYGFAVGAGISVWTGYGLGDVVLARNTIIKQTGNSYTLYGVRIICGDNGGTGNEHYTKVAAYDNTILGTSYGIYAYSEDASGFLDNLMFVNNDIRNLRERTGITYAVGITVNSVGTLRPIGNLKISDNWITNDENPGGNANIGIYLHGPITTARVQGNHYSGLGTSNLDNIATITNKSGDELVAGGMTAHQLDGALHTVTGLTGGHFLKALSATTFGFAAHGLTYSDVGALAVGGTAADSDKLDGYHASSFLQSVTAHNLLSATHGDTTTGSATRGDMIIADSNAKWIRLAKGTSGYFLKAGADDIGWSAHGLTYSDVGALASGGTAADASKLNGQSAGYYAIAGAAPAAHQFDGALHTVSGLTPGTFLKATGATTFGFAAHGLTYSDVGALAAGGMAADSDKLDGLHSSSFLTSVTAHNLLSTTHGDTLADTVVRGDILYGNATPKWARLAKGTSGYFLKAGASDISWAAHGLTYSDVGALAAAGKAADSDEWDGYQFADYLDQAVKTTSSPAFTKVTIASNIGHVATNSRAIVYRNADQTIAHNSDVVVQWDTETTDPGNKFDIASTYDYTTPVAGIYQVNLNIIWNNIPYASGALFWACIRLAGVNQCESVNTIGNYMSNNCSALLLCSAGQKIDAIVHHTHANSQAILGGLGYCNFSVALVQQTV